MLNQLFRSLRGNRAGALNEAGIAAWHRGDLAEAERRLREAIAADAGFAPAYANLGMVVWEQRRLEEGVAMLRNAVSLDPSHLGARVGLANALVVGNVMGEAISHYREVLRRQPDHTLATANLLKPLLDVCDWDGAERLRADLVARWQSGNAAVLDAVTPFASLLVELPAAMRLAVARRYTERVETRARKLRQPTRQPHGEGRLRIGYASADFHNHATAHLAAGMFEHHDRDRFEVHAYSFGVDDGSDYRARLVAGIEHFHDVRALPPDGIAERIAADGIDILVDLKGYTAESRPEIFALRPAPLQVSYLGYPGTMGARFIDVIVGDAVVTPLADEGAYDERIVRMPDSYQVNDDRQAIDPLAPTRAECGLPGEGFVFACFNKHHKIERRVFETWMRMLRAVPGSVLWLLGGHGEATLRRVAAAHGVEPSRIVFAGKLPKARHLARHRCADLFLDTCTYNAHTTASDALWAGLPVLTCPGRAFASRVGASLLMAVGLPDLVVSDLAAYECMGVALATDPAALQRVRAQLAANRLAMPLFRTGPFTRALESAYEALWEERAALPGARTAHA